MIKVFPLYFVIESEIYNFGLVVGQEKDVSLFLDRTGEPAM